MWLFYQKKWELICTLVRKYESEFFTLQEKCFMKRSSYIQSQFENKVVMLQEEIQFYKKNQHENKGIVKKRIKQYFCEKSHQFAIMRES